MVVPSIRSPSPLSTRPNPKAPDNNTTRRSFSGFPSARPSLLTNPRNHLTPTTPANSPSDFGRRHSIGKEGMASFEEKENEKEPNFRATKLRSPAKGAKNFMSPTISAASKFTPSPRKKVLVERNEPVRTSISLSDGKAVFFSTITCDVAENFDPNPEADVHHPPKSEVASEAAHSVAVSKPTKRVTFMEVPSDPRDSSESLVKETVALDSDSVDSESILKKMPYSCSNVSPIIAPLDADPSAPPYDPKTNYLSPRPQFLRYRPNRRIEVLLNKEKEMDSGEASKQLEHSFMSDLLSELNLSDSDGMEESHSEDSQKESDDSSLASDVVAGADEQEEEVEEEKPIASEQLPISTPVTDEMHGETAETKMGRKPRFMTRVKSVSLLLVFLIACVSVTVTDSPILNPSLSKDFPEIYYDLSEVVVFAKSHFDGFSRHVKKWSANSILYVSKLISGYGEVETLNFQYANLTFTYNDALDAGILEANQFIKELDDNFSRDNLDEEEEEEEELETEEETESWEQLALEETDLYDTGEEELESPDNLPSADDVSLDMTPEAATELEKSSGMVQTQELPGPLSGEAKSTRDTEGHLVSVSQTPECQIELESPEIKPVSIQTEISQSEAISEQVDISSTDGNHDSSDLMDSIIEEDEKTTNVVDSWQGRSEENLLARYALLVSLLCLPLLAAFIFLSKRKGAAPPSILQQSDLSLKKKEAIDNLHKQQPSPSTQNWPTEVDLVGESCPSEMSSFGNRSSYDRNENEAHSHEKKPRKYPKRESLASSEYSMGSPSYGSFTTYERIKHASGGEEEIMTPVRRSSRIRKQVTSS